VNALFCTRLAPEHISGAAMLERLCFAQPWSEKSLTLLCTDAAAGFAVLSMPEGQVVGYLGVMTVLDEGQITNVAVHPDFRRQGCGDMLLGALMDYAKQNHLTTLTLEVRESNAPAIALYEKHGFIRTGLRRNFYTAPIEAALILTKTI